MKIAVSGADGRLGSQLVSMGCVPLKSDITSASMITQEVLDVSPDVVINCAAYTNVDGAETKKGWKEAQLVNFRGVENVRLACLNTRFIHISTDYVFDGQRGPYTENYVKYNPLSNYGFSKLGGEIAFLTERKRNDVLIRTTGLYGGVSGKHDFSALVRTGEPLKITKELRGNQTYVPHLAEALLYICNSDREFPSILNIGSKEVISRYKFALMLAKEFGLDKSLFTECRNVEVPTWKAVRPTNGGVKVNKAKKLGVPIYSISDGIKDLRR